MLELDISYDEELFEAYPLPLSEPQIQWALERLLAAEKIERPCALSLSFVTDRHMQELNQQWRGVSRPTDVLSLECERPDDPDLALGEPCSLGDIILAPAYIQEQAAYFETTWADELRLLLCHGLMHLLGYDHRDEAEALIMEAREFDLLSLLDTDNPVSHVTLVRHRKEDAHDTRIK